jgi:hypothetical protein
MQKQAQPGVIWAQTEPEIPTRSALTQRGERVGWPDGMLDANSVEDVAYCAGSAANGWSHWRQAIGSKDGAADSFRAACCTDPGPALVLGL